MMTVKPVYNRMMYIISIQFSADYIDDRHEHKMLHKTDFWTSGIAFIAK